MMSATVVRQSSSQMLPHHGAPMGYHYQSHQQSHHGPSGHYYSTAPAHYHNSLPLPHPSAQQYHHQPQLAGLQRNLPPSPPASVAVPSPSPSHSCHPSRHQSPLDYGRQSSEEFPSREQFDKLLDEYISSLSPKKRDKALIPQKRYDNILAVLKDPKCTTIESAQFRFWAKKMFRLADTPEDRVCHEGKPVAVREALYDILTKSHAKAQHGGRDKTSTQVRSVYSWVPKELIARFVRNCPTCIQRRSPNDYPSSVHSSVRYSRDTSSPEHHIPRTTSMSMGPMEAMVVPAPIHNTYNFTPSGMEPTYAVGLQTDGSHHHHHHHGMDIRMAAYQGMPPHLRSTV